MSSKVGNATWVVTKGEGGKYRRAGAENVVEVDGRLVEQRNAALEMAWTAGWPCCQIDDDLVKSAQASQNGGDEHIPPTSVIERLAADLRDSKAQMAGIPPTPNSFFFDPERRVGLSTFIIASLIVVKPCGLFFDPAFRLKMDYDYTCQHLAKFGQVLRLNDLLVTFKHYANAGGLTGWRTAERMAAVNTKLMEKWPGVFRHNPRRPNEVLMKWRPNRTLAAAFLDDARPGQRRPDHS